MAYGNQYSLREKDKEIMAKNGIIGFQPKTQVLILVPMIIIL